MKPSPRSLLLPRILRAVAATALGSVAAVTGCNTTSETLCADFSRQARDEGMRLKKSGCPSCKDAVPWLRIPEKFYTENRCPAIKSVDNEGEKNAAGECCFEVTIDEDEECVTIGRPLFVAGRLAFSSLARSWAWG